MRRWSGRLVSTTMCFALSACRLGFDALPGDASATTDDAAPVPRTITFGDRATSDFKNVVRDTMLREDISAESYGGTGLLSLYAPAPRNLALYAFDLGAVPAGTRVTAARLHLHVETTGDTVPGSVEVYRITEGWVEGVLDASGVDGASWNLRAVGQPWTTPGGTRGERAGSLANAGMAGPLTLPIDAAVVQSWVDAPAMNHGLLVLVPLGGTHFHPHASESPLADARPELALDVL